MDLVHLGWTDDRAAQLAALQAAAAARGETVQLAPARVIAEHRGAVQVAGVDGVRWAELLGRLRHEANDRRDLPAVGDWVACGDTDGSGGAALIHAVLPRRTCFLRLAAGERVEPQVIAANVDLVLIVTSASADFNIRRLERYLTAVAGSGADAVLVLNKIDLADDLTPYRAALAVLAGPADAGGWIELSATRGDGLESVQQRLGPGVTVALVGSSGVGKSTLVNQLLGREVQAVGGVRVDDDRGRHTTTHRQLIAFAGGLLIDTPGMRELKPWVEPPTGAAATADRPDGFAELDALAERCRFRDCEHRREPGCAVQAAVAAGELVGARLAAWHKLAGELVRTPAGDAAGRGRYRRLPKKGSR